MISSSYEKLDLDTLRKIPFFYDMSDINLEILVEHLTIRNQDKSRYIFKKGDAPAGMYFILEGEAKVIKKLDNDTEIVLEELSYPHFFGEESLIEGRRREFSVVTLSDFKAIELSCENFAQLKELYPKIALNISLKIARMFALKLRKLTTSTQK